MYIVRFYNFVGLKPLIVEDLESNQHSDRQQTAVRNMGFKSLAIRIINTKGKLLNINKRVVGYVASSSLFCLLESLLL